MNIEITDASLRKNSKLAGFLFLFFITFSILHFSMVDANLAVSNNIAEITDYIKTNEFLFRIGIVLDIVLFVSGILLALVLYKMLKPIHKFLASFALFMSIIQFSITVITELSSFISLLLVNPPKYLSSFETEQLQALLGLCLDTRASGYTIAILFFNIGFIVYSYLFLKSKYIPKALAIFGLFSFTLMLVMTCIKISMPNFLETIGKLSSILVMLFQIVIGLWFLIKSPKSIHA